MNHVSAGIRVTDYGHAWDKAAINHNANVIRGDPILESHVLLQG